MFELDTFIDWRLSSVSPTAVLVSADAQAALDALVRNRGKVTAAPASMHICQREVVVDGGMWWVDDTMKW